MENGMEVPQKVKKIELPYDPAIPLLGIHLKETKWLSQRRKKETPHRKRSDLWLPETGGWGMGEMGESGQKV